MGRLITTIVWHEDGERAVLCYDTGDPDYVLARRELVDTLAREEGLKLAGVSPGLTCWTRDVVPATSAPG